jgi:Ca-activated chloride channel homolog
MGNKGETAPQQGPRRRRGALLTAAVAVVAAGVAVAVWVFPVSGLRDADCEGPARTVTVAVSPGQHGLMSRLATEWNASKPKLDGRCLGATVVAREPNAVVAALGSAGEQSAAGPRPDVWVPDSAMWLAVASSQPNTAAMLPPRPESLASSPLVLAVRRPVATALGWPARPLSWEGVAGALVSRRPLNGLGPRESAALRVGMPDPTRSTAGAASVVAFLDRNADGNLDDAEIQGGVALTNVLGAVEPDASAFLQQAASTSATSQVAAFPVLERDLAKYLAEHPSAPWIPAYGSRSTIVADYPYAILKAPWVDAEKQTIAQRFLEHLRGADQAFGAEGYRSADRSAARTPALQADRRFRDELAPPRPNPAPAAMSRMITEWTSFERPANVLVVLDTSGSMDKPVPGTKLTRLELLQQTALYGYSRLTNLTSMGLWQFSTRLTPRTDHRELVPVGPSAGKVGQNSRLEALQQATRGLRADGGTGLYDTAYAAFRRMQALHRPNHTNAILFITDGRNEDDPVGLTKAKLLTRLAREARPQRPTPIIGIAVGPEADAVALQQIAQATGGRILVARDPARAVEQLILAFAGRLR